jgi:hypothetical protein
MKGAIAGRTVIGTARFERGGVAPPQLRSRCCRLGLSSNTCK